MSHRFELCTGPQADSLEMTYRREDGRGWKSEFRPTQVVATRQSMRRALVRFHIYDVFLTMHFASVLHSRKYVLMLHHSDILGDAWSMYRCCICAFPPSYSSLKPVWHALWALTDGVDGLSAPHRCVCHKGYFCNTRAGHAYAERLRSEQPKVHLSHVSIRLILRWRMSNVTSHPIIRAQWKSIS